MRGESLEPPRGKDSGTGEAASRVSMAGCPCVSVSHPQGWKPGAPRDGAQHTCGSLKPTWFDSGHGSLSAPGSHVTCVHLHASSNSKKCVQRHVYKTLQNEILESGQGAHRKAEKGRPRERTGNMSEVADAATRKSSHV